MGSQIILQSGIIFLEEIIHQQFDGLVIVLLQCIMKGVFLHIHRPKLIQLKYEEFMI